MKRWLPNGDTYKGMLLFGGFGGAAFALLSMLMFVFRAQCEPILRFALPLLAGRRSFYRYNPDNYYFWALVAAGMSILWITLMAVAIIHKPETDRRIEKNLKSKLTQAARGAPLEPH